MNRDRLADALEALPMVFERYSAEMREGLGLYHNAIRLMGMRPVQVGVTGSSSLLTTGPGRLCGWSLRATAGDVTVLLRDSRGDAGATGDILATVELLASTGNKSDTQSLNYGVSFGEGVYLQAVGAGQLQGAVFIGAVDA